MYEMLSVGYSWLSRDILAASGVIVRGNGREVRGRVAHEVAEHVKKKKPLSTADKRYLE